MTIRSLLASIFAAHPARRTIDVTATNGMLRMQKYFFIETPFKVSFKVYTFVLFVPIPPLQPFRLMQGVSKAVRAFASRWPRAGLTQCVAG
jgi:hypothetical protein